MAGEPFQLGDAHGHRPAQVGHALRIGGIAERLAVRINRVKLVDDRTEVGQPRPAIKVGVFVVPRFVVQARFDMSTPIGEQPLQVMPVRWRGRQRTGLGVVDASSSPLQSPLKAEEIAWLGWRWFV